ncbi:TetR/AcrR family transcriptional regulator [Kribbella sancticallisti]|uniref:TetR/AcrR family transcriptional regulator n=1 Tax=Kribbella sancticallisti TaxID=460087 RepID=A0ABN2D8L2_9ACTN
MTTRTPRERYREQTRDEIKDLALAQLAEGGVSSIALTRIAKELGLSGPALYRYFAGRDDLVHALIRDAYDDLATAIEQAATSEAAGRARLVVLAESFRGWARKAPHRYLLIAGAPLPGYEAPADTVERARAALGPFLAVFADGEPGPALKPLVKQLTAWAKDDEQVRAWVTGYLDGKPAITVCGTALAGAITAWTRLHGVISLEVEGQFQGMGFDPGTLLTAETTTLADAFALA